MVNNMVEQPRRLLQSLNLSIDLLELLSRQGRPLGVTEIATLMGISKAAAHGILSNLAARSFVEREALSSAYRLGRRLWELGMRAGDQMEIKQIAREHLAALTEITGESTQLSEYCARNEVLYLDRITSPNPVQAFIRVGGRAPAHCTATGKVLLAFQSPEEIDAVCSAPLTAYTSLTDTDPERLRKELQQIRETGVSLNPGEYRGEIVAVAAAIRDRTGDVIAAVSVSGPQYRFPLERAEQFAGEVVRAALQISEKLGYVSPGSRAARRNVREPLSDVQ